MTIELSRRAAVLGLGTAALSPGVAHADLAGLTDAARKEASLTWYVAQMSGEAAEDMGRIFTRQYPGISVSVVRTTGQVAYQRIEQELKNAAPQCDVFSTTDIAHMPALRARGALANYVPQNAAELAAPFVGLGEAGYYYATTASLQIMIYQTQAIPPAEVPRNWTDLIDPKWKNRVAVAHPAFSGYFGQWVLAMRKLYGWQYFEKLAQNKPRIGRSGKAPRPNAARLFLEWLLSVDYARACGQWHLEPVRADAPLMPGTKRLADLKLLRLTTEEIANGIPEVIEQWRDTFGS